MNKFKHSPYPAICALLALGVTAHAQTNIEVSFDEADQLSTLFGGYSDFAQQATGGLSDGGAVTLTSNSQVAVYQTAVSLSDQADHTISMYFRYNGADGDGGTGRGFFVGLTSGPGDTYDSSASTTGVDVRAIVAGSGSNNLYGIDLQNDGALVSGSVKDVPLVIGNWYRLELVIGSVTASELGEVTLTLYAASEDGTVGDALKTLDNEGSGGYTLASTLGAAGEAYPFFGGQNPADRISATADQFTYSSAMPQPETVIYYGTPSSLDGIIDSVWHAQVRNDLTVDITGTEPVATDISGYWKAMWDETYLYFLIVAEDDVIVEWPGSSFWRYDMTELFIDADYSRNDGETRYDENDFQLYFPRDGQAARSNGPAPVSFPLNYTQVTEGTTTVIELALPWDEMTVVPMHNMPIGVDLYMKDNDDGSALKQQISWSPSNDQAWRNPSLFGTAVLMRETATPVTEVAAGTPAAIDGVADAIWDTAPANHLTVDIDGTAPTPENLSGYWKALWDEQFLYVLMVTTDDIVSPFPGSSFWRHDITELFIDGDYSRNDDVVRYDANDFQIYFPRDGQEGRRNGAAPLTFPLNAGQVTEGNVTTVEVALPWSEIGVSPVAGMPIGIDVYMKDNDDGTDRANQIAWSPSRDEAWRNPSLFGTGVLIAADHPQAFIALTDSIAYPSGNYWSPWFEQYFPIGDWSYHYLHGWLYTGLASDAAGLPLYSFSLSSWIWTTAEFFPAVYEFENSRWVYFEILETGGTAVYVFEADEWLFLE